MKRLLLLLVIITSVFLGCKKDKKAGSKEDLKNVTINAVAPSAGPPGTIVTITGTNFGTSANDLQVLFEGKAGIIESVTPTEIKVVAPVSVSGRVTIQGVAKAVQGPNFTYINQGMITDISPASGNVGTLVKITGPDFGAPGSIIVSFNGKNAEIKSANGREILAVVPETSSGHVMVTSGGNPVQGPLFEFIGPAAINDIAPAIGPPGTVVTVTGSNFGTSSVGMEVLFNGKAGIIQAVLPTELKVVVPVTSTGPVMLSINKQTTNGPTFTYQSPLSVPYTGGNVLLSTQAEVDAFVNQNKGKPLKITGSLTISGNDISSVSGLSNITSVMNILTVSGPLLNDLSFLRNITAIGTGATIRELPATSIDMSNLSGAIGMIQVKDCKNLRSLNFRSLNNVAQYYSSPGKLTITGCDQLNDVDLSSLTTVLGSLTITGTALQNFSHFNSLQKAGAMTISNNPYLSNFKGLESLTSLTRAGATGVDMSIIVEINGLNITGNEKLASLEGLQNLTSLPLAKIQQNGALSDLCPMKTILTKLSAMPDLIYYEQSRYTSGRPIKRTLPILTFIGNGKYTSLPNALEAIASCN